MNTAWNQLWCRWYPFGKKWIKHLSLIALENRVSTSAEVKWGWQKTKKNVTCVKRHAHVLLIEIHWASSVAVNKQKGKH